MRRLIVLGLSLGMAVFPAAAPAAFASAAPAYALTDVGTFGGPQASLDIFGFPITHEGAVLGTADTTVADHDYPNFNPFIVGYPDPFLTHAFKWRNGRLTDLGALPGNNSSAVFQHRPDRADVTGRGPSQACRWRRPRAASAGTSWYPARWASRCRRSRWRRRARRSAPPAYAA